MRGRYFWARRGADDLKRARDYFQQAISRQPDYALAYAGLADAYLLLANTGVLPPREVVPKAKEAALKALALDDGLAEAHTSLGGIACSYEADWAAAEREYRRAFEINPNYQIARQWWGQTLAALGRHTEAAAEIQRAQAIDPVSVLANSVAGQVFYHARQYDKARNAYEKALELDPHYAPAHTGLGRVYAAMGWAERALSELERGAAMSNRQATSLAPLGHAYAVFGRKAQALEVLQELQDQAKHRYMQPAYYALVYIGVRDYDRAFEALFTAAEEYPAAISYLNVAPEYDPLRTDRRFDDLLRRVHLDS